VTVRVCIADDHLLMLFGIRDALLDAGDIDIVGLTHRGDEVVSLVDKHQPDLVLLDHHMPGVDGLMCLREVKRRWRHIQVVMLSASEDPEQVRAALAAGASAYIGKRVNPDELASLLRQVVAGVVYQHPSQSAQVAPDAGLTPREQAILEEMAIGHSTVVISRNLWITQKTVKFHLTNIYRKLGVHNRTGAMSYAFRHGLIAVRPDGDAPDAIPR
jgi:DNA-binding NarL/FixJ family response regulator